MRIYITLVSIVIIKNIAGRFKVTSMKDWVTKLWLLVHGLVCCPVKKCLLDISSIYFLHHTNTHTHTHTYIYIYIYIMSRCLHRSPWPSLATSLYRPSHPAGYILYRHRAVVYSFLQIVVPLLVHVKRSKEYMTYGFILTSPTVSRMSGSSNFDNFHDGWKVAVQLVFWGLLSPKLVQ